MCALVCVSVRVCLSAWVCVYVLCHNSAYRHRSLVFYIFFPHLWFKWVMQCNCMILHWGSCILWANILRWSCVVVWETPGWFPDQPWGLSDDPAHTSSDSFIPPWGHLFIWPTPMAFYCIVGIHLLLFFQLDVPFTSVLSKFMTGNISQFKINSCVHLTGQPFCLSKLIRFIGYLLPDALMFEHFFKKKT